MPSLPDAAPSEKIAGWMVHLLTASGIVCGLLAIEATYASQWRVAFAWLALAVWIDAIDGTFARMVSIKRVLPGFDGALLDNLVDYANFVIVPALIMHRAGLLPPRISFAVVSAVCLASTYQFCQGDAKTEDHFFKGFPSYWNIVALYLLAMGLGPWVNLVILLALIALVFVPIKYVYVSRTSTLQRTTLVLSAAWAAALLVVLVQLPSPQSWLVYSSLLYVVYYVGLSLWLTWKTAIPIETTVSAESGS